MSQEIGRFFVPDWIFPLFFEVRNSLIFVHPPEITSREIRLRVQGHFEACSSLTDIIEIFPPLKLALKPAFYLLPTKARRALLDPLETLFYKGVSAGTQLTFDNDLARAAFLRELEDLTGQIFDELVTAKAPKVFKVCERTWAPDARITLTSPSNTDGTMLGTASPFWDINRIG